MIPHARLRIWGRPYSLADVAKLSGLTSHPCGIPSLALIEAAAVVEDCERSWRDVSDDDRRRYEMCREEYEDSQYAASRAVRVVGVHA